MNSRQKKAYWRHPATEAIKTLLGFAFIVALGLIIVFWAGLSKASTSVNLTDLEGQMANVCHQSYQIVDGKLEQDCAKLIDQVQSDGKHEVLESNGNFWTETN